MGASPIGCDCTARGSRSRPSESDGMNWLPSAYPDDCGFKESGFNTLRQPPASRTSFARALDEEDRVDVASDRDFRKSASRKNISQEDISDFKQRLVNAGIDPSAFGQGTSKSLQSLYWEVYLGKRCTLVAEDNGCLKRIVSMVQINLVTQDLFGIWRTLLSTQQFLWDGRPRHRTDFMRKFIGDGESKEFVIEKAMEEQLGLSSALQAKHVQDVRETNYTEEEALSHGYPGLMTQYCIQTDTLYIRNAADPELNCIGLPDGRDFAVMEGTLGDSNFGARLRIWSWSQCEQPEFLRKCNRKSNIGSKSVFKVEARCCPIPHPLVGDTRAECPSTESPRVAVPNAKLVDLMAGQEVDWTRAQSAAARIRDPNYGLQMFHDDVVAAFPELRLYLADHSTTSSGRSGEEEYNRTMGAIFAVYWLMRLDLDGKEGFTFGVDEDWKPWKVPHDNGTLTDSDVKRIKFHANTDWDWFTDLFCAAGLLSRSTSGVAVCKERCLAFLVLTAVHDIMKIQALLPTVQSTGGSFHHYNVNDIVNDHDEALGYIMERYPELLPSFRGLEAELRRAVEFTQSKLEYNQGWLVQAEAPPSALFSNFKKILQEGGFDSANISLYFAHWITDLAGAEADPLAGAEKFVLKFPHSVLQAFLRSFPLVQKLAHASETEVFEEYLNIRWNEHDPRPLTPPIGAFGIAMKRLLCQAQGNADHVLFAFMEELSEEDKDLLSREMAKTGCPGQRYADIEADDCASGPAFLMYYAPALLQKFGDAKGASQALRRLVEVYKQARALWPEGSLQGHVTVRIDTIKDLSREQICDVLKGSGLFLLVRHNDREAFVERRSLWEVNEFDESRRSQARFLTLVYDP